MKSFKLVPSVDRLLDGAVAAVRRFPLALLCAVVASVIAVILIEYRTETDKYHLVSVMVTAALGIPLFIAFTLIGERQRWPAGRHVAMQGVGIVVLVLYFLSLPSDLFRPQMHAFRLLLLGLGLHFLVAFGPWVGKTEEKGFWQYNKSLLISFLTAAVYSASLFVGLAIALVAADYLFGLKVSEDTYFQLWALMAGIANTWIFLALVPRDLETLSDTDQYPNALKVFTQYVLLPLVGLYFIILIAYEAKIIVDWNWPKGWVSQLVLWYSVVGVLSLLLLHPLREREGSTWIGRFGDWYFRLMVPLVIMLVLAIRRRIIDYGVTEPRYLVVSLAVGLSIVVLYFIFSRRKDIRIVPIVLFCLAIVGTYGPLSASSISTWSQTSRLEALLIKNGLLNDGVLQKPQTEISVEARREMSSVIAYLSESRGPEAFAGWLSDSTMKVIQAKYQSEEALQSVNDTIAHQLGFAYNWSPYYGSEGKYISLWAEESPFFDIAGYQKMLTLGYSSGDTTKPVAHSFGDFTCSAHVIPDSTMILVSFGIPGDTVSWDIRLDLAGRIEELCKMDNPREIPQDSLTFDRTTGVFDTRIFVRNLHGEKRDGKLGLNSLRAQILVRKRM